MASQTYTVKSGDTLSGIAKKSGVGISDISGYASGDPNLIRPGETLTIGAPAATKTDTSGAKGYSSAVSDALGGSSSSTKSGGTTDDYLSTLRTSIDSASKAAETAAKTYSTVKTKAYNDAYASSGLGDIKTKISGLDDTIAAKKAERDAAIAKVRANPGLSAALLTGTVKKLADSANNDINNLIGERNTLAGTYNTGLTEVNNKVSAQVGDAEAAYTTAQKALETLTGQAKDYQSALSDALKQSDTKAYQDQSLAIQLMNAQTAANKAASGGTSSSWKLAISPLTGKPIYWYNSNGETKPLTAADLAAANGTPPPDTTAPADTSVESTPASGNWFSNLLSSLNPFK